MNSYSFTLNHTFIYITHSTTHMHPKVATEQKEVDAVGGSVAGSECAALGQDQVQTAKAKLTAAKTAAENAENDAASRMPRTMRLQSNAPRILRLLLPSQSPSTS